MSEQETVVENKQDQSVNYEAEAAKLGWKPEEEYTGEAPWKDAETYYNVHNKRDQDKVIRALKNKLDKIHQNQETMIVRHAREQQALRDQYERDLAAAKAIQEEAEKDGDLQEYKKASEKIEQSQKKIDEINSTPDPRQVFAKEADAVFHEFASSRETFNSPAYRGAFEGILRETIKKNGAPSDIEELKEIFEKVEAETNRELAIEKTPKSKVSATPTAFKNDAGTVASFTKQLSPEDQRMLIKGVQYRDKTLKKLKDNDPKLQAAAQKRFEELMKQRKA